VPVRVSGEEVKTKVLKIQKKLQEERVWALVVTSLDEIAWLFNLRGSDIEYNPVFHAYAIVTNSEVKLFVDTQKFKEEVLDHLDIQMPHMSLQIFPYDNLLSHLKVMNVSIVRQKEQGVFSNNVWLDAVTCNAAIYQCFQSSVVVLKESPIALLKAVKNEVELHGMRQCHVRDGVALVTFLAWLDGHFSASVGHASGKENEDDVNLRANISDLEEIKISELAAPAVPPVTELSAAEKLRECRSKQENFVGLSFKTISSFGPNGAVVHYTPSTVSLRTL
jgi:Xaa-Pro aminopeptidase